MYQAADTPRNQKMAPVWTMKIRPSRLELWVKALVSQVTWRDADGDEVEVELEDGKVVIKPLASLAKFKRELRGCVESSKIDPLEAKRIWEA